MLIVGAALAALLASAFAGAQEAPRTATAPTGQPTAPSPPKPRPMGYLTADEVLDGTRFLPPYPAKGSAAEAYDLAAYREALKQENTPRWKQAIADDNVGLKDGLTQFQCAVGVTLTTQNAPTLMTLLGKSQLDTHWSVEKAKSHFKRPRPFADDEKAATCLPIPAGMRSKVSTAYPGGHSTLGMAWGLILAELAPDRAPQIMDRVRDYSHSRLVCGIHYPADLEAGHTLGAALVARLHGEAAFRADMDKARAEVAAARRAQTAPLAACAAAGAS
jgi:acid phosphatase (class A)